MADIVQGKELVELLQCASGVKQRRAVPDSCEGATRATEEVSRGVLLPLPSGGGVDSELKIYWPEAECQLSTGHCQPQAGPGTQHELMS